MSNSSASGTQFKVLLFGASGYIVIGATTAILSVLIALSIAKYSALRQCKELVIVMGLATADFMNTMGFFAAGLCRLSEMFWPRSGLLHSWECLIKPHVWLWSVAYPLSALMLVIVSTDRLLLVVLRRIYICDFTHMYAWKLVGVSYLFCTAFGVSTLVAALIYAPDEPWLSPYCWPAQSTWSPTRLYELHRLWYEYSGSLFPLVSVLIFMAVGPVRKYNTAGAEGVTQAKIARQKKLTKSIAVSCFCTFVLAVVPGKLAFVFWNAEMHVLAYCCWHLVITNPLANAIIFIVRHSHIRTALKSMLAWKQMPLNLELWPKRGNQQTKTKKSRVTPARNAIDRQGNVYI